MMRSPLTDDGLVPVTRWARAGGDIRPMTAVGDSHEGWVYAFVIGNRVMFVGATDHGLGRRLDEYRAGAFPAARRVRARLKVELAGGRDIEVFARPCDDPEAAHRDADDLIEELDPPWNRQRRS